SCPPLRIGPPPADIRVRQPLADVRVGDTGIGPPSLILGEPARGVSQVLPPVAVVALGEYLELLGSGDPVLPVLRFPAFGVTLVKLVTFICPRNLDVESIHDRPGHTSQRWQGQPVRGKVACQALAQLVDLSEGQFGAGLVLQPPETCTVLLVVRS